MNASCNWVNLFKSVQISSCAVNKPLPARRYRPTSAVLYLSVCLSVTSRYCMETVNRLKWFILYTQTTMKTSISCRQLTRATKSWFRRRLTIAAINYSGRASELLSTKLTNDGPVYHALSVHLSRTKLIARSTIDIPWRNFLSPEFRKKFQREVPLFL